MLKAEQRYSGGFKLLYKAGRAIGKIYAADRIQGRADGVFKLARVRAANAPLLDEFDWRGFWCGCRLRVRARTARNYGGNGAQDNPKPKAAA